MKFVDAIFGNEETVGAVAFYFPDSQAKPTTYDSLHPLIGNIAQRIYAVGVAPGGIVCLDFENEFLHAAFILACIRAGIATVSASTASILGEVTVQAIFSDKRDVSNISATVPLHAVSLGWGASPQELFKPQFTSSSVGSDALCRVMLTSGTTGKPKATYLTYDMVQKRIDSYASAFGDDFRGTPRIMSAMQLSSSLGFGFFLHAMAHGGSYCADSKDFSKLEEAFRILNITTLVASPATLAELIEHQATGSENMPLFKSIYTAGSLLAPKLDEVVRASLCDRLVVFYGTTETGVVSVRSGAGSVGNVGQVVPGKRVKIVDTDGMDLPCGQSGSIRILDASGALPFFDHVRWAKREPISFFQPGDHGILNEDGSLVVLGRDDGLINSGGVKITPEALEHTILGAPGIRDCGVVTQPDALGIDRIVALLVLGPSWNQPSFLSYCENKISQHFLPAKFVAVKAIPRNQNGKIDRVSLAKLVQ